MKRHFSKRPARLLIATKLLTTTLSFASYLVGDAQAEFAYQLFYTFPPGESPVPAGVIQGSDGNLYGPTHSHVYRITLAGVFTNLCSFTGAYHPPAKLVEGTDGNFYGTTTLPNWSYPTVVNGTLFRPTPSGTLTTLATFDGTNEAFGAQIFAPLTQTTGGTLVGTTYSGGPRVLGTIFQFRTDGVFSGVLSYSFDGTNGAGPHGGLIQAADGSLYGTTTGKAFYDYGGPVKNGTVFRVSPQGGFVTLFTFGSTNGESPWGNLMQAADGALYGTTSSGGLGYGTVFRITTNGVFTSLFSFAGANGANPTGELIQLSDGNLYGTTSSGGTANAGTVFRITPNGILTTIVSLNNLAGQAPQGGLCLATDGNLYGTTSTGGPSGYGTIFRLVSSPVITSKQLGNGLQLTWTSFLNAVYRVEYRTNIGSGSWLALATNVISSGSTTSYIDSFTSNEMRFYRVVLLSH